jgi:hypothetical protein
MKAKERENRIQTLMRVIRAKHLFSARKSHEVRALKAATDAQTINLRNKGKVNSAGQQISSSSGAWVVGAAVVGAWVVGAAVVGAFNQLTNENFSFWLLT